MGIMKTINVTIVPSVFILYAVCETCGAHVHYEFGMTYKEALIDLFTRHAHEKVK